MAFYLQLQQVASSMLEGLQVLAVRVLNVNKLQRQINK